MQNLQRRTFDKAALLRKTSLSWRWRGRTRTWVCYSGTCLPSPKFSRSSPWRASESGLGCTAEPARGCWPAAWWPPLVTVDWPSTGRCIASGHSLTAGAASWWAHVSRRRAPTHCHNHMPGMASDANRNSWRKTERYFASTAYRTMPSSADADEVLTIPTTWKRFLNVLKIFQRQLGECAI